MHNLSFVFFDFSGLSISILILLLALMVLIFNYYIKPNFVVPFKNIILPRYFYEKFIILLILLWLFIIPLNPYMYWDTRLVSESNSNIQILFDVSLSTTSTDVWESRNKILRNALYEFIDYFYGYNIWIITYSSIPFNWQAFSTNTSAILRKVEKLNLSEFPPTVNFVWTAVWDAMYLWLDNFIRLYWDDQDPNYMVLFTDWNFNRGSEHEQAAELLNEFQIPVYVIAAWRQDDQIWYDSFWNPVMAVFGWWEIKKIANASWWKAFDITWMNDISSVFSEISNDIEQRQEFDTQQEYIYLNKYIYLVISILLFLYILNRLLIYKHK